METPAHAIELADRSSSPTTIGRMLILARIGEGGMGIVYAAYDPELDRKVAVKMLRQDRVGGAESRTRLLREAQALARLAHPNVVAVHDVGMHAQEVWIAMEFVKGRTVASWLAERRRGWREVVEVFQQAALGLEAAHQAGLLHRDLKPANIMIGEDGRVRVMDFGLVRSGSSPDAPEDSLGSDEHTPLSTELTQTGSLMGTPAYMAPEQFLGFPADERSDQFSLCVALWEALHGQRPFAAESAASRTAAQLTGQLTRSTNGRQVPGWLRRVVERGLASRREARFASVGDLRRALKSDPTRTRMIAGLGLGVTLAAGLWISTEQVRKAQVIADCAVAGARIDEVWNEAARERLRGGLIATGVGFAATTADRVMPWLDDHAREWKAARIAVCRGILENTWEPALTEQAAACLDEDRQHLESMLATLSDPGDGALARSVVQGAVSAAAKLPLQLAPCRDENWLRTRPRLPSDISMRQEIRRVNGLLVRAVALERAGLYRQALNVAERAHHDANTLAWSPLQAATTFRRGMLQSRLADYEAAEEDLKAAYFAAGAIGEDQVFSDAATWLTYIVGYRRAHYNEALGWGDTAIMLYDRFRIPAMSIQRAHALNHIGLIHKEKGEHGRALELFEQALVILETTLGASHPDITTTLTNLGNTHSTSGRYAQAVEYHERARRLRVEALGPDHPDVAISLSNLGNIRLLQNDYDRALDNYMRALVLWERALQPDHPDLASVLSGIGTVHHRQQRPAQAIEYLRRALVSAEGTLGGHHPTLGRMATNIGNVYTDLGQYEQAIAYQRRALAIFEAVHGPDHVTVASVLINLGSIHNEMEQYEQARVLFARGLEILEKKLGPDHAAVAVALANLGSVTDALGAHEQAIEYYQRALALEDVTLSADDPTRSVTLTGLGIAFLSRGDPDRAVPLLERALALREADRGNPRELANTRFALARALWPAMEQRARSLKLARQAWEGYHSAGEPARLEFVRLQAWLTERGQ